MELRYFIAAGAVAALMACGPAEQPGEDTMVEEPTQPVGMPVAAAKTVLGPDGVTIHYDDQGQGPATIVFVHGWSCDRSYWDAQRDHFASSYRVVTIDLAGHGASSDERDAFTMESFGADVAAVAQALDLKNIVLVGHSMGGPVVLAAGNLLKGRLAAVVGVDTLRGVGQQSSEAQIDERIAKLDMNFVGDVKDIVRGMFTAESDPTLRDSVVEDMASAPPRVAKSAIRGMSGFKTGPAIASLDVPLVLINSDYRPTNRAAIQALTDSFQYIEMSGVGHFVMMEDADTFNRHLQGVIDSVSL
jgi:pimeloyl-ACP methyl ester carboxylesterase